MGSPPDAIWSELAKYLVAKAKTSLAKWRQLLAQPKSALIVGVSLGVLAGFLLTHLTYRVSMSRLKTKAISEIQTLKNELESVQQELESMKAGHKRLTDLMNALSDDWDILPKRPVYMKAGNGVIIYWDDGMIWRRYNLYAEAPNSMMRRYNRSTLRSPFYFINNPARGRWRFGVRAMNRNGQETPMGEILELNLPLP
jgi:hypothetical protein